MSTRPHALNGRAGPAPWRWLLFTPVLMAAQVCSGDSCPGAGALDATFGVGGKVTTDFGSDEFGNALAIQADGKIVVAGTSDPPGDFALARYNADGTLDANFGTGGLVTTDFAGFDQGRDLAIQADGKIVVAGGTQAGLVGSFALARYNTDGTLDPAFGTGGLVTTDFPGSGADEGFGLDIQADGRILVAGTRGGIGVAVDFALARYNTDGSLDASFGAGGVVTTNIGGFDQGRDLAIQADGKIVVVGSSVVPGNDRLALVRYDTDGTLDSSFGTGGLVTAAFAANFVSSQFGLVIQGDGRTVVAGSAPGSPALLARYNTDGTLDASFGSGGISMEASASWEALAIGSNGRIVVVGGSTVARYNSDGTLDASFGSGGVVTDPDGIYSAVAIQSDAKTAVAGTTSIGLASFDFLLARFGLSACEQVQQLIADVQELVVSGALTTAQGNGLIAKLDEAIKVLEKGNVTPGINKLQNFNDQVESLVRSGKLSPVQAQELIDAAAAIIQSLGGSLTKVPSYGESATSQVRMALAQNSPNPFNPTTTIQLTLPRATEYILSIFDVSGRLVRRYEGHAGPGEVTVVWDGRNDRGDAVPSGVYFYAARAAGYTETKKMVMSK